MGDVSSARDCTLQCELVRLGCDLVGVLGQYDPYWLTLLQCELVRLGCGGGAGVELEEGLSRY